MRVASPKSIGALALLAAAFPVNAQPAPPAAGNACTAYVAEAERRSGLSGDIVLRVMMAESGGNPSIVSVKGAMGCMQIMPATWTYLTSRYDLGADPFDARRNMTGGALYLAELVARLGMPGALAAYNAGPGRYERYAAGHTTLPAETIAYAARIGARASGPFVKTITARWQEASLFIASLQHSDGDGDAGRNPPADRRDMPDAMFPLTRAMVRAAGADADR